MIKAVIFDLWGTLFYDEVRGEHPFRKFAKKINQNFDDYEFLKIFEKYLMLEKHYNLKIPIENLLKELGISYNKKLILGLIKLLERRRTSQKKPYPETLKILGELKKGGYKLSLITNTFYYSFQQLNKRFNITKLFDVILKSYEIGILKPNSRVFKIMLEKLKVKRNEVLMIGDSLKDDIEPAKKFGIKAILIDRKNKYLNYPNKIKSLNELNKFL